MPELVEIPDFTGYYASNNGKIYNFKEIVLYLDNKIV